jgi:hypothetical protein
MTLLHNAQAKSNHRESQCLALFGACEDTSRSRSVAAGAQRCLKPSFTLHSPLVAVAASSGLTLLTDPESLHLCSFVTLQRCLQHVNSETKTSNRSGRLSAFRGRQQTPAGHAINVNEGRSHIIFKLTRRSNCSWIRLYVAQMSYGARAFRVVANTMC